MSIFYKKFGRLISWGLFLSLTALFAGCASNLTTVAPRPPEKFERLGYAKGEATGSLCSFYPSPALSLFPIMLNDRVERAYANAISNVPGATGLINVTYEESWYWFVFGNALTVTISGEAIKEVK